MNKDKIIRVFIGTELSCLVLKGMLEEAGVIAFIKDELQSSIHVGYASGTPTSIELYISDADLKTAQPLIDEFVKTNPQ